MTLTLLPTRRVAESLLLPAVSAAARSPAAAPAPALMTDFLVTAAASIEASASLGEAERRLLDSGVGLLIVVDELHCVTGVIDRRDLRGERAAGPADQPRRAPGEMRVVDVVTRLRDLDTLDLATLATAMPAQVLHTLQCGGRDHLLVVEPSSTAVTARLRGVVTRAQADPAAPAPAPGASRRA